MESIKGQLMNESLPSSASRGDPSSGASAWVKREAGRRLPRLRLLCFPFAGGVAGTYRSWGAALPPWVEVCPVELPGRGARIREPLFERLDALVSELTTAIAPLLDVPFAFYGHSLGAFVAFEASRELRSRGLPDPLLLAVAAARAPRQTVAWSRLRQLEDGPFADALLAMGGIDRTVLDTPELRDLVLPMVRADWTLIETREYREAPPLACPILALRGADDRQVQRSDLIGWGAETRADFEISHVPGPHLFVNDPTPELFALLSRHLRAVSGATHPTHPRLAARSTSWSSDGGIRT
jgi:medium-chain acyl-[acyl-carrier-protein] hydrolase